MRTAHLICILGSFVTYSLQSELDYWRALQHIQEDEAPQVFHNLLNADAAESNPVRRTIWGPREWYTEQAILGTGAEGAGSSRTAATSRSLDQSGHSPVRSPADTASSTAGRTRRTQGNAAARFFDYPDLPFPRPETLQVSERQALLQNAANLINAGRFDIQSFHPFQGVLSPALADETFAVYNRALYQLDDDFTLFLVNDHEDTRVRHVQSHGGMPEPDQNARRLFLWKRSNTPTGASFYQLIGSLHTEAHNTAVLKPLNAYAGVSKARFRITGPDSLMDRSTLRLKARTRRS